MIIYFIYKVGGDKLSPPTLYAITRYKKLKKEFLRTRKKGMFIVKEHEVEDDKILDVFNSYKKYILDNRKFITKSDIGTTYVTLVATDYEEFSVYTKIDTIYIELTRISDDMFILFNKKILKALNIFLYNKIQKMKYDIDFSYADSMYSFTLDTDNSRVDELGMFLHFYGNTLDKNEVIK